MKTKTEYPNINFTDTAVNDKTNPALLSDINTAAIATGVLPTVYVAKTGHGEETNSGTISRHSSNNAVDLSYFNNVGCPGCTEKTITTSFATAGDKIVNYLINNCGYSKGETTNKATLWKTTIGGNHWNHAHVSNTTNVPGCKGGSTSSLTGTTSSLTGTTSNDVDIVDYEYEPGIVSNLLKIAGFNENDGSNQSIDTISEEIKRIKTLMK